MPTFHATIKGEFTKRQSFACDTLVEAMEAFRENRGDDITETASGLLEVSEVEQVVD